ncbi:hypothetical protein HAX54_022326 [Datura stramonium]|uniref:Uncharacterized protein n=1 Tax=Datura stramonium TaxID=4076 RepID=A0ABS8UUD6_DATST|nr:hypothetical protein [Datura stramonium]
MSNTDSSDATSGKHPNVDPAIIAANIEVEAGTGNQAPLQSLPVPPRVAAKIESLESVIQMLASFLETMNQHTSCGTMAMGSHGSEAVEFVEYQLKDAHA